MRGAIIGDIIGSAFINRDVSTTDIQLFKADSIFTDDTVLTLATADSVMTGISYKESLFKWVKKYPKAGFRPGFKMWVDNAGSIDYRSEGDGAARRVSPIGYAATSISEALSEAAKTTLITHNHPDRIEASQAVAVAIYLANNGATLREIKAFVSVHFGYDLSLSIDYWKNQIKSGNNIVSPVPAAFAAFFNSSDFEEAIRNSIYIGGPTNTVASIAGGLAHAYFQHIPKCIVRRALSRLTPEMESLILSFENRHFQFNNSQKVLLLQAV